MQEFYFGGDMSIEEIEQLFLKKLGEAFVGDPRIPPEFWQDFDYAHKKLRGHYYYTFIFCDPKKFVKISSLYRRLMSEHIEVERTIERYGGDYDDPATRKAIQELKTKAKQDLYGAAGWMVPEYPANLGV